MKLIGTSDNNGRIVELTLEEYNALLRLGDAVAGKSVDCWSRSSVASADYADVFSHIRAFSLMKFRINELQKTVDELNRIVEGK